MIFFQEFIDQSLVRLNENTPRIVQCLEELTEDQVWLRPNDSSNSIGNLILHLCGNIRQYIIAGLGGKVDIRERPKEFLTKEGYSKKQLLTCLKSTLEESNQIINKLDHSLLMSYKTIQGFKLTGIGIVIHVVEHYSFHTGQITFYTKLLQNKDLKYYDDSKL